MKRRDFLLLSLGGALFGTPLQAAAWKACGPFTINGGQYCYAGIRSPLGHVQAAVVDGRHHWRWSWAACTAMLCGYAGHRISQQQIVTDSWGSIGSMPETPDAVLAGLEGRWVDQGGRAFRIRSEPLPLRPQAALDVLGQDRPVVLLTASHPVVLTTLRFISLDDVVGDVQAGEVSDPHPAAGPRRLTVAEWYGSEMLAGLHITREHAGT
ncbi:MAG: hypothetical protein U5K33_10775 [Halofilum sp. (in: g-proteobacteria)]|nr:hypothetical protein [Halofilum sp. (in: g-proteobacteria)]